MSTPDQVRAPQEPILNESQGQQDAPSFDAFAEAIERGVEFARTALAASDEHRDDDQRSSAALPPSSEAVGDFLLRAMANPHIRELIARLADE